MPKINLTASSERFLPIIHNSCAKSPQTHAPLSSTHSLQDYSKIYQGVVIYTVGWSKGGGTSAPRPGQRKKERLNLADRRWLAWTGGQGADGRGKTVATFVASIKLAQQISHK